LLTIPAQIKTCKLIGKLVNFVKLQISAVPTRFSKEVTPREIFLEPAIQSAYLEPNSQSLQKPIEGLSLLALSITNQMKTL
jgi:hypothetical protein